MSPVLESLARQLAGRVKLVKVNVDESPALAQRFQARSIPMLLVLRNGSVRRGARRRGTGVRVAAWLEQAIAAPAAGR